MKGSQAMTKGTWTATKDTASLEEARKSISVKVEMTSPLSNPH